MKITRLFFFTILFFLLKIFLACTTTTPVSKEDPAGEKPLFLLHNETGALIDFVDIFLKEMRLLGCEVKELSSASAQDGNEKDKGFYGSGFFISENGLFLTAYHVIEQAETIILRKINGKLFMAKVLIQDPINDIKPTKENADWLIKYLNEIIPNGGFCMCGDYVGRWVMLPNGSTCFHQTKHYRD